MLWVALWVAIGAKSASFRDLKSPNRSPTKDAAWYGYSIAMRVLLRYRVSDVNAAIFSGCGYNTGSLADTPRRSKVLNGDVAGIFTAALAQAPMESIEEAMLEAGKGLVGDRYHRKTGTFSDKLDGTRDSEVTLIESEEIERFNQAHDLTLGLGDFRRNIVTRNVRLNPLVGHQFRVGGVVLEGIRLCEPCAHLAKIVTPEVLPGLVHRAGLRACIVKGGLVNLRDRIVPSESLEVPFVS